MAENEGANQGGAGGAEEVDPKSEHINLRVVSQVHILLFLLSLHLYVYLHTTQDGTEVYFKIKKQTPLRKLMDAYCQRQGISPNSIRFLYDGQRIQAERTPKEV